MADHPKILFHNGGNSDAELFRKLACESKIVTRGKADREPDILRSVDESRPDLVVLDLELKAGRGISRIRTLQENHPGVAVLVTTVHDQPFLAERVLRAGAMGYVVESGSSDELMSAIRCVLDGKVFVSSGLSRRLLRRLVNGDDGESDRRLGRLNDLELEVYAALREGRSRGSIESALELSAHALDSVLTALRSKLELPDLEIATDNA